MKYLFPLVQVLFTKIMASSNFIESITNLCYNFFSTLPKTGKPKSDEWTVLSCIVKSSFGLELEVVSLGTGSKCIGVQKMSPKGDILNDSHAEIMARRGFLRYLYEQIELAFKSKMSIFIVNSDQKCALKPDLSFHLFTSQSPCGDGSIVEGKDGLQFAGGLYLHAVEIGAVKLLKNSTTHDKIVTEEHSKRNRTSNESHESRQDDSRPLKKIKFDDCSFIPPFEHPHKNVESDVSRFSTIVNSTVDVTPLPTETYDSENCPFTSSTINNDFRDNPHKKGKYDLFLFESNAVDKTKNPYENIESDKLSLSTTINTIVEMIPTPNTKDDSPQLPKQANCELFSFVSNEVGEIKLDRINPKLDDLPLSATISTIVDMNSLPGEKEFSENCPFSSATTKITFDESAQLPKKANIEKKSFESDTVDKFQRNVDSMLGRVRTKPGKGDPTASLSCSDKIARWLRVGIQGALLSLFLDKPIHLDSIIVGGGCPFSKGALYRALVDRSFNIAYTNQWTVLEHTKPVVYDEWNLDLLKVPLVEQSTAVFEFAKREGKNPSSASIVWSKVEYL